MQVAPPDDQILVANFQLMQVAPQALVVPLAMFHISSFVLFLAALAALYLPKNGITDVCSTADCCPLLSIVVHLQSMFILIGLDMHIICHLRPIGAVIQGPHLRSLYRHSETKRATENLLVAKRLEFGEPFVFLRRSHGLRARRMKSSRPEGHHLEVGSRVVIYCTILEHLHLHVYSDWILSHLWRRELDAALEPSNLFSVSPPHHSP